MCVCVCVCVRVGVWVSVCVGGRDECVCVWVGGWVGVCECVGEWRVISMYVVKCYNSHPLMHSCTTTGCDTSDPDSFPPWL